ncbi:FAD/NAD(P)-binding protein [Streptomyces zagrosensis]|uniref:Methylaspartate mutase epsilon subunit n=1 Tax=Streptomyces zagrosensis TaxID=1042984 RepID=A0A7W9QEM1_9ACTN|nr:FAD/NAD(P)-binding protein [Streptomyces zagrosensis]MBB5938544.1 methylaspartate mutase epsilon subunit [Streptomyces zagrosensis]
MSEEVLDVAIVGTGPRGISVFERIAANLTAEPEPRSVRIWLIDAVELGAGRIWRTDQETCFLMNTVVGEISMFSGVSDGEPCRPGAGLSFQQWLHAQPDPALAGLGHDDYAPRYAYGRYLRYVYDSVVRGMSGLGEVVEVVGKVTSLREEGNSYELRVSTADDDLTVTTDAVVITTGHAQAELSKHQCELARFAQGRAELRYLSGDSAADLDIPSIAPRTAVGVVGLGLSFYDILMSFTVGRGGKFKESIDGAMFYVPSGNEPWIVAGSRSGLPIRSRGRNQKGVTDRAAPKFLTSAAIGRLRERSLQHRGSPALDFDHDVLPLLQAEINYVYYTTQARAQHGPERAEAVAAELRTLGPGLARWREVAVRYALHDVEPVDLDQLSRPLHAKRFNSGASLVAEVRRILRADIAEARQGNVDSPLKAALDAIRDSREVLRHAVDFGGLTPRSQRADFLDRFGSRTSSLFTGPPLERTAQFLALIDARVLDIVGPDAVHGCDAEQDRFFLESPAVEGSRRYCDVLIDSRIPIPGLVRNTDPLMRQLVAERMAVGFVHGDAEEVFHTGALHITPAERRVISADDRPHRAIYALGIPTEGVCWFTQIGNGRPGVLTSYSRDADVIALSVLRRAKSNAF